MTSKNMRQLIAPLIQMCADKLTFLAHDNILLNQTHRIYTASVLLPYMPDLVTKVLEDYELFFGENFISKINDIKANQQALQDYKSRFKTSLILERPEKIGRTSATITTTTTDSHRNFFKRNTSIQIEITRTRQKIFPQTKNKFQRWK